MREVERIWRSLRAQPCRKREARPGRAALAQGPQAGGARAGRHMARDTQDVALLPCLTAATLGRCWCMCYQAQSSAPKCDCETPGRRLRFPQHASVTWFVGLLPVTTGLNTWRKRLASVLVSAYGWSYARHPDFSEVPEICVGAAPESYAKLARGQRVCQLRLRLSGRRAPGQNARAATSHRHSNARCLMT